MNKRRALSVILIAASAGLAIAAYILLPETVIIQLSIGASGNSTSPKLLAILIPTALGIGGAVAALTIKDNESASVKSLIVSVVGIAAGIIMLAVNLFAA